MAVVDKIVATLLLLWRYPFRTLANLENGRSERIFASIPIFQQNFLIFKSLHKSSARDVLSYSCLCFPYLTDR
jgi:hypothetical protein